MNIVTTKYHNQGNAIYYAHKLLMLLTLLLCFGNASAAVNQNTIKSIQYSTLTGNRIQITLDMTRQAVKPLSFTIDNPARIAFDFANTDSVLPKKQQPIGIGVAQSVTTISAKNRTRVILNLTEVIPYQVTTKGNSVLITLDSDGAGATFFDGSDDTSSNIDSDTSGASSSSKFSEATRSRFKDFKRGIKNIDFRRGENGEGRIIVTLTENNIPLDISEEFGKVVVKFIGSSLPDSLHQSLDVLDFATPVKSVSSFKKDNDVRIEIEPATKDFEHVSYQADNIFTIELKPIVEEELEAQNKAKFGYTGERLSLNFQDIPVRAVLQLIADFTSLNVVVSDSVSGNLTLRLKNVPWDQDWILF